MPRRVGAVGNNEQPRGKQFIERLQALLHDTPKGQELGLTPTQVRQARTTIQEVATRLGSLLNELDPVQQPQSVFDPANPGIVARFVALALLAQQRFKLQALRRFYGSGVYALYYTGDLPVYAPISRKEHPIYVGKADPADPSAKVPIIQGERLSGRLKDHERNIVKAKNLRVEDFECRFLVVQSGWQIGAEGFLIHIFKPIWNDEIKICYGAGKHGDSPQTRGNQRSPWDTLHPGREWAHRDPKMKDARAKEWIESRIKEHMELYPPLVTIDEVVRRLIDEMRQLPGSPPAT